MVLAEILRIQVIEDTDPAFELPQDAQPVLPLVLPHSPSKMESTAVKHWQTFQVSFTPREQRIHNGTVVVKSRDPETGEELPDVKFASGAWGGQRLSAGPRRELTIQRTPLRRGGTGWLALHGPGWPQQQASFL